MPFAEEGSAFGWEIGWEVLLLSPLQLHSNTAVSSCMQHVLVLICKDIKNE